MLLEETHFATSSPIREQRLDQLGGVLSHKYGIRPYRDRSDFCPTTSQTLLSDLQCGLGIRQPRGNNGDQALCGGEKTRETLHDWF